MERYEALEMEMIRFDDEADVITQSCPTEAEPRSKEDLEIRSSGW